MDYAQQLNIIIKSLDSNIDAQKADNWFVRAVKDVGSMLAESFGLRDLAKSIRFGFTDIQQIKSTLRQMTNYIRADQTKVTNEASKKLNEITNYINSLSGSTVNQQNRRFSRNVKQERSNLEDEIRQAQINEGFANAIDEATSNIENQSMSQTAENLRPIAEKFEESIGGNK